MASSTRAWVLATADLVAHQRAGRGERHVDGGVAHLLGGGRLGLGDAVERLLLAQGDGVLQVWRGACLHALRLLARLADDAFGFGGGLRQRALGVGLGLQGLVAQPLGIGQGRGDVGGALVEQGRDRVHRILPSRTTNSTKATRDPGVRIAENAGVVTLKGHSAALSAAQAVPTSAGLPWQRRPWPAARLASAGWPASLL